MFSATCDWFCTDGSPDGRQAEKGQTSNDLVPGFERMDQAGHDCWCITTGDRSGKMAKNHQSHRSADSTMHIPDLRERVRACVGIACTLQINLDV